MEAGGSAFEDNQTDKNILILFPKKNTYMHELIKKIGKILALILVLRDNCFQRER